MRLNQSMTVDSMKIIQMTKIKHLITQRKESGDKRERKLLRREINSLKSALRV